VKHEAKIPWWYAIFQVYQGGKKVEKGWNVSRKCNPPDSRFDKRL